VDVERAAELYAHGLNVREIATHLGRHPTLFADSLGRLPS
jgi:Helix-turn-helix domain